MTQLLEINVTEARKEIYSLIDRVSRGTLRVIVKNTDTNQKAMIVPFESEGHAAEIKRDLAIVSKTAGLLQGGTYYPDEIDRARNIMLKKYMKKYEKK